MTKMPVNFPILENLQARDVLKYILLIWIVLSLLKSRYFILENSSSIYSEK